jgi:hypothetical protein
MWGSKGRGDGEFDCVPCGVAVDGQGNVYNINGTKVGSVNAGGNIVLIGGAARLLFYGVR